MKNIRFSKVAIALVGSVALASGGSAYAKHHAEMSSENIVQKAANTDDFSTLVAAVTAADLAGTLSSDGPFTVFAPLNSAFAKLPEGTVETLIKPENKDTLTSILTYHVISGRFKAKDVMGLIKQAPDGVASIPTVQGGVLKASMGSDGSLMLTDAKGGTSKVVMADVNQSNGVIHAIDTVVMP
ncbi:fasciclin domain-containing protein [Parasphingorhabdus cellanae]|uniref:Fasciclin domain-containing protein n=1 Tax=Parasphingorhabdus cellanae TaxID=2806553 RepID=A0ABX7T757_9SPHN|nr:fasciclin domain-containing protein [Parasphingorhabdus cellanae]QTD56294.1 fasciclin domain-containing protein [Parasphingorhabdus cellanae]